MKTQQDSRVEPVLKALLKEAKEWYQNGKGRVTGAEVSAWIDGATASLSIVDPTFALSNAALEALEGLFYPDTKEDAASQIHERLS